MLWLTSDCHFNHKNILKYEKESRPFGTLEEHNQAIIDNWNKCVKSEDEIWVLGDFFLGPKENIPNIINQLNGEIHLVKGNHDSKNRIALYKECGIAVHEWGLLFHKGYYFLLCHYPTYDPHFEKVITADRMKTVNDLLIATKIPKEHLIHCYGHVHGDAKDPFFDGTSFHVGVDTNNLSPISLDAIIAEKEQL